MKILLVAVNGSYVHTNLAVRCLRNSLEKNGFEVCILEKNLKDRYSHIFEELYNQSDGASIIGFSTYIWNKEIMFNLASDLKKVRNDSVILFGGPEVSYNTERFDGAKYIDCIITGEGEESIVSLAKLVDEGKSFDRIIHGSPLGDTMNNAGIIYKEGDYPSGSMLYYESSRGCPYSCAYCLSSAKEGIRYKDLSDVITDLKEFEKLPENIKIIKFVDRTFNFPQDRANSIWKELLKDEYTKNYHFELCASLLNEESFEILSMFPKGKIQLEFGLQSTNLETLKACSRHISPDLVIEKVDRVHRMGNIHVHLDLIAGLPYEGYESFKKSFNDSYFCCDKLQLGFLKLLYGTKLRKDAELYGIKCTDNPPYAVLETNWLSCGEVIKLKEIDELLERFNDGDNFENCLSFAILKHGNPFEFYEGLIDYIKNADGRKIQFVSQIDAFKLLYGYVSEFLDAFDLSEFETLMHKDFEKKEKIRTPKFLRK